MGEIVRKFSPKNNDKIGLLYTDLSTLSSALQIADKIIIRMNNR